MKRELEERTGESMTNRKHKIRWHKRPNIPVIPIKVNKPDSQIKRDAKTLRFD